MVFRDSNYKFINPVRYFKENDPYYFEVDNIPVKQLEENILWLKDQIEPLQTSGIGRGDFSELRPYVEGGNNNIIVNPGKYSARVNDAYNIDPQQRLSMFIGSSVGTYNAYENPNGTTYANIFLNRLRSSIAASALQLNGIMERVLTFPVINEDFPAATSYVNNLPSADSLFSAGTKWPILGVADFYQTVVQSYGVAYELQKMSAEFTKQFRGIARTAIVDVPERLQLAIPNFDDNDFFYYNSAGVKTLITGSQVRLDLLFIYSKPIDQDLTTLQKWESSSPTQITTPVLGLVRGAGMGIRTANGSIPSVVSPALDSNGNTQIIASIMDQSSTTNGFHGLNIHGSFPSPDDLMNQAPLISEKLAISDPQLIGQTILPIAYIVVRKTASTNSLGNVILTNSDVIDIRPFFRTTELTNNERAGIAAAMPQLSLANPVVTKFELSREANRLVTLINQVAGQEVTFPRVVAGGTIWGGLTFGPEGAINNILTTNGITQNVFTSDDVPALPDWDVADWWDYDLEHVSNGGVDKGSYRNDRINFYHKGRNNDLDGGVNTPAGRLAIWDDNGSDTGRWAAAWVKKKILIDTTQVAWMQDYTVRVNLENCVALSHKVDNESTATAESGSFGIFVEKQLTYFMIYVWWSPGRPYTNAFLPQYDRGSNKLSQWAVRSSLFPLPSISQAQGKFPLVGVSTYPTVSFEVIGYPESTFNKALPQFPGTPQIILR